MVALPLLCGCSSETGSDWPQVFDMMKTYWGGSGSGAISLDQAAAVPYASIGVRVGDSSQALFVLATQSGDALQWLSGQRVALTTRDGRIVRTAGLAHNLVALVPGAGGSGAAADWSRPATLNWVADLSDPTSFSVQIRCQRAPEGMETLTVLGKQVQALKVEERCAVQSLDWSFVNSYWVDPTSGLVWKSIQTIHPALDPVEIETLRPPG